MEKRTLLAVILTAGVWILWFTFFKPPMQKKKLNNGKVVEKSIKNVDSKTAKKVKKSKSKIITIEKSSKSLKIAGKTVIKKTAQENGSFFKVESNKYKVTLNNKGASITSIKFKDRKDTDGNDLEIVVQKTKLRSKNILDFPIHFDEDEFLEGGDLENILWDGNQNADGSVIFSTVIEVNGNPVKIQKIFSFPEKGYTFNVTYKFINLSKNEFTFPDKRVIISPTDMLGPNLDFSNTYNTITGIYSLNGEFEQQRKGGGFFSKSGILNKEAGNINWIGIMSRYMLIIMIPEDFSGKEVISDNRKNTGYRIGMSIGIKKMGPGSEISKSFKIYLGEKNKDKLIAVDENIRDAADVSKWIEPIRYIVMWCLFKLNGVFGNFGWALVVFSIVTKIIFMPLTLKSTESMKKMQSLSPKINEIKKKYKDKPDMVQKETMSLYKEHKVNPLGGCFPLLLQMPFFFGLYSALINSIDLWNAPFIFWMKDLAMPDTVMHISGYSLNILPILMTLSTFLQQKMTAAPDAGQQQKMMMYIMPVVFLFIFWSMPSGLVLYWTLQNGFQVLHQVYVNKRKKPAESS